MARQLPLDDMQLRHRGLTQAVAANNREAATVCLSRHHTPPATFTVENNGEHEQALINWIPPDSRVQGAWNNRTDTTEMGAVASVIAGVELVKGHFAVRRAENATGADYYIGRQGAGIHDLEDCYRLEISGVDAGNEHEVRKRMLLKVEQARRGKSNLPAVAGVVGFSMRLIVFRDVEDFA